MPKASSSVAIISTTLYEIFSCLLLLFLSYRKIIQAPSPNGISLANLIASSTSTTLCTTALPLTQLALVLQHQQVACIIHGINSSGSVITCSNTVLRSLVTIISASLTLSLIPLLLAMVIPLAPKALASAAKSGFSS